MIKTEYTLGLKAAIAGIILAVLAFFFWLLFLNHVAVTDIGVTYDSISGNIAVQEHPGWYG